MSISEKLDLISKEIGGKSDDTGSIEQQLQEIYEIIKSGAWPSGGGGDRSYSMNERVIGTWVDGKPLYQVTIEEDYTSFFPTGENITLQLGSYDFSDADFMKVEFVLAQLHDDRDPTWLDFWNLNFLDPSNKIAFPKPYVSGGMLILFCNSIGSAFNEAYKIDKLLTTVQYTKSTDTV